MKFLNLFAVKHEIKKTYKEKRQYLRKYTKLLVYCYLEGEERQRIGFAQNISAKGINLIFDRPLSVNQEVSLKILIPHQIEPLIQRGIVVWNKDYFSATFDKTKSYQMGIEFF